MAYCLGHSLQFFRLFCCPTTQNVLRQGNAHNMIVWHHCGAIEFSLGYSFYRTMKCDYISGLPNHRLLSLLQWWEGIVYWGSDFMLGYAAFVWLWAWNFEIVVWTKPSLPSMPYIAWWRLELLVMIFLSIFCSFSAVSALWYCTFAMPWMVVCVGCPSLRVLDHCVFTFKRSVNPGAY